MKRLVSNLPIRKSDWCSGSSPLVLHSNLGNRVSKLLMTENNPNITRRKYSVDGESKLSKMNNMMRNLKIFRKNRSNTIHAMETARRRDSVIVEDDSIIKLQGSLEDIAHQTINEITPNDFIYQKVNFENADSLSSMFLTESKEPIKAEIIQVDETMNPDEFMNPHESMEAQKSVQLFQVPHGSNHRRDSLLFQETPNSQEAEYFHQPSSNFTETSCPNFNETYTFGDSSTSTNFSISYDDDSGDEQHKDLSEIDTAALYQSARTKVRERRRSLGEKLLSHNLMGEISKARERSQSLSTENRSRRMSKSLKVAPKVTHIIIPAKESDGSDLDTLFEDIPLGGAEENPKIPKPLPEDVAKVIGEIAPPKRTRKAKAKLNYEDKVEAFYKDDSIDRLDVCDASLSKKDYRLRSALYFEVIDIRNNRGCNDVIFKRISNSIEEDLPDYLLHKYVCLNDKLWKE
jgi:hypothetical protein